MVSMSDAWLRRTGVLLLVGCAGDGRDDPEPQNTVGISESIGSDDGGDSEAEGGEDADPGDRLDVGSGETEGLPCGEGMECDDECVAWEHEPCDDGTNDVFQAMGLNCPGEETILGTTTGSAEAMGIRTRFGATGQWNPREGSSYAVIGSGVVADLDIATPPGDANDDPRHCNDELGGENDVGAMLPAPLMANNVTGDCATDPGLLGTGDCSNTVQEQFSQGGSAYDYTELRIVATVPETSSSLSYDFAFFSTEYPFYYNSVFNDMYVGWLESESWTGNISFDEMGEPISLNAGFLDFRDDAGNLPDFDGTCMKQHAGTKWLNTTAPVTPGETVIVVLAIFDLSDPILDSYVFLDNFDWGCEGEDTPSTTPVG